LEMSTVSSSRCLGFACCGSVDLASAAERRGTGAALSAALAERAVLETYDDDFDPWRFARDGHASIEPREGVHSEFATHWRRTAPHLSEEPIAAWARVRWKAHDLDVVRLRWREGFDLATR